MTMEDRALIREGPGGVRVRRCGANDRESLVRLGHLPGAVRSLAPTPADRLVWATRGVRAVGIVAEETGSGRILGSVHFVGSRRDPETWMFGHWRVDGARRRTGIGRLLVSEGLRLLPEVRRLYSYVDWGNDRSILAHERIGFERATELHGRATLGELSRIGPPAPAVRARRVRASDRTALFPLFRRAMGPLWMRLFPGTDGRNYLSQIGGVWDLRGMVSALWRAPSTTIWRIDAGGSADAFLVSRGSDLTLYLDPSSCSPALLTRTALWALGRVGSRDLTVELRGLNQDLVARTGELIARTLMGLPEADRLRAGS